jgi:predicted HicB family RNase H-like nuclease
MKKPRKKPNPELRVRIDPKLFKAVKMAVARNGSSTVYVIENALHQSHAIIAELKQLAGNE